MAQHLRYLLSFRTWTDSQKGYSQLILSIAVIREIMSFHTRNPMCEIALFPKWGLATW